MSKSAIFKRFHSNYFVFNSTKNQYKYIQVIFIVFLIVFRGSVYSNQFSLLKQSSAIHTVSAISWDTLNNVTTSVVSYHNREITLNGSCVITITDSSNPLQGSILDCISDDIWLYFPSIRPNVFDSLYRGSIKINGATSVADVNIRITQYLRGTMVISHPKNYQPLEIFSSVNCIGSSMKLTINNYYRTAELNTFNNNVRSFHLNRGYMATFAQNEDGTGVSRVYIADNEDVIINQMPLELTDISFIRILPWRWTAKKGWPGGAKQARLLDSYWTYDWNNTATSTFDLEYVPMRHNMNWNAYANINNKVMSTHALGFNEPDRPDQANMSVDDAIMAWPELMKSGLRIGAPAPSDAGPALAWLYEFIDRCDSLNYRVDFIPLHWYKGGQSARQFYDWLKAIHIRTRRPVWITEWNNGANWTSEASGKPSYEQQAATIKAMVHMLDTAGFVERYSIYEWVEDTRQMFYSKTDSLTAAGKVYRDEPSLMAYNHQVADLMHLPCISSQIIPYLKINNDSWQKTNIAYVSAGTSVTFGPHPWSGGAWSWKGPGGFTTTEREITISNIQTAKTGNYIVTHTNSNNCSTIDTFTINIGTPVQVTQSTTTNSFPLKTNRGSVLYVLVTPNNPITVAVVDLKGMVLYKNTFTKSTTLSLDNIVADGVYIVKVLGNKKNIPGRKIYVNR